jgi:hypothetical protein
MNRFEFRIWGDDLSAIEQKLATLAGAAQSVESKEIYFVAGASDDCTAKIRSALLDIKVLLKIERRLEQWSPILKSDFPIAAAAIDQLFKALKLEAPHLPKDVYTMDEFLNDEIESNRQIAIVKVHKRRNQFKLDDCQAEFSPVTINDIPRQTVAVESEDPDQVLAMIDQLGIRTEPNVGYVREIKRLLSILPRES